MTTQNETLNLKERIAREDAYAEVYAKIGQRLGDRELFVLMHLAELRSAYEKMLGVLPTNVDGSHLLPVEDGDTISNITKSIRSGYGHVAKAIYALYIAGLVEKTGSSSNPQSWRITREGGQVLNIIIQLEKANERSKPLSERYSSRIKKKEK